MINLVLYCITEELEWTGVLHEHIVTTVIIKTTQYGGQVHKGEIRGRNPLQLVIML